MDSPYRSVYPAGQLSARRHPRRTRSPLDVRTAYPSGKMAREASARPSRRVRREVTSSGSGRRRRTRWGLVSGVMELGPRRAGSEPAASLPEPGKPTATRRAVWNQEGGVNSGYGLSEPRSRYLVTPLRGRVLRRSSSAEASAAAGKGRRGIARQWLRGDRRSPRHGRVPTTGRRRRRSPARAVPTMSTVRTHERGTPNRCCHRRIYRRPGVGQFPGGLYRAAPATAGARSARHRARTGDGKPYRGLLVRRLRSPKQLSNSQPGTLPLPPLTHRARRLTPTNFGARVCGF